LLEVALNYRLKVHLSAGASHDAAVLRGGYVFHCIRH